MKRGNTNERNLNLVYLVAAGAGLVLGGWLLAQLSPLALPDQASAGARQIDGLFRFMLFIGGAIFFLVQGLLIYSIVHFRRRPGDASDGPPMHGSVVLEITWTIIPAIIVTVLAIYAYSVWTDLQTEQDNETVIYVTGQRFVWNFAYPYTPPDDAQAVQGDSTAETVMVQDTGAETEADAAEGEAPAEAWPPVTTFSDGRLHVYIGQHVVLEMQSADVIHAFWVPALRLKQDLIPGRTTTLRFTPVAVEGATYPLEYRVVCAELCGGGHGQMFSYIIIWENEDQYLENFYNPAVDRVLNPPADPAARGEQVLRQGGGFNGEVYACAGCHTLDALGWMGQTGPNLNGIGDRAANRQPGVSAYDYLYSSLYNPNGYLVPGFNGGIMPHYYFEDNGDALWQPMPEVDHLAIVAYLCGQTASGEPACTVDQAQFEALTGTSAEAAPEATAEAAPETAAEATAEATAEAAPETAAEATPDAAPEATAEATPGS